MKKAAKSAKKQAPQRFGQELDLGMLIGVLTRYPDSYKARSEQMRLWSLILGFFTKSEQGIIQSFLGSPDSEVLRGKATRLLANKLRTDPNIHHELNRSVYQVGLNFFVRGVLRRQWPDSAPKAAAPKKKAAAPKKKVASKRAAAKKKAAPKKKAAAKKAAVKKVAPKEKAAPKKKVAAKKTTGKKKAPAKKAPPKKKVAKKAASKAAIGKKGFGGPARGLVKKTLVYKPAFFSPGNVEDAGQAYIGGGATPRGPVKGATRKGGGPPNGDGPTPPEPVTCHFQASMENPALLNRTVAIAVVISREEIEVLKETLVASASSTVDAHQQLMLNCRPVKNFKIIGASSVPQPVPEPGNPATLAFNGQCTAVGPCELAIDVWQGQLPVCSLVLTPECVAKRVDTTPLAVTATTTTPVPLAKPVHELIIFERIEGPYTYYDFQLDSPVLNIKNIFESSRINGPRDQYVAGLYKEIEDMWQLAATDESRFQKNIRQMGARLFAQLIPDKLKAILWEQRDKINSIMVISTEPFIPWELVLVKDPNRKESLPDDKFLCEMGLVRWLFGWRPAEELTIRKEMARYVIPEYLNPNRKLTGSNLEKKYLASTLGATPVTPDPDHVEEILRKKNGFDLLHFSCHAEVESDNIVNGKLILQDTQVGNQYSDNYLTQGAVEELEHFEPPRPMIFLSACKGGRLGNELSGFGGFAKAFLDAGAGAFVGALWSIEEGAAYIFMKAWYDQLKAGKSLAEATVLARRSAARQGDATYLAYVVYGHPNAVVTFT